MLYKSLKPLLIPELVSVLSRAKYYGQEHKTPQILEKIKASETELLSEHWEHLVRLLTFSLVREMYWLGFDIDEVEKSHIKMWILAKATLGRVGLPYPRPTVPDVVVDAVYATLKEAGRRYLDKIAEEQSIILNEVDAFHSARRNCDENKRNREYSKVFCKPTFIKHRRKYIRRDGGRA